MIKHHKCNKEFKMALNARFIAFRCLTTVRYNYTRDDIEVKTPFVAEQIYQETDDLLSNKLCQAEVHCPKCEEWYSIDEFEFYAKCGMCGESGLKMIKVFCRKSDKIFVGCCNCIKARCVESCPKRGLCESYREVLYRLQTIQRE